MWIVEWKPFERFIMIAIALNSLVLAMYDYRDRDGLTTRNETLNIIGDLFTSIFLIEASLKIIAAGFIVHSHSYLRSPWNAADFIIVCFG